MLTEFENKIADFAKANKLFDPTSKVLLAVSGGADSTAMLHTMQALKSNKVLGAELLCAHLNHQLRGAEADKDKDFVIAEAAKLKLSVITKRVDVRRFAHRNKLSIETSGRQLRIEALIDIAKTNNCQAIVTAHHKNDNAETVLQRLSRGTGYRGLGGIRPKRSFDGINFVRPFLCVKRAEIIEYLKKQNIKWRDDHTNIDCTYRRNFIRHQLIPELQKNCSGSIAEQLFELSGSAQRFYNLIGSEIDKLWPKLAQIDKETISLDLKTFSIQPQPVKVELIRRGLTTAGSGERDLTHRHYEKILQLAEQKISGKKIALPNGFIVQREHKNLIFIRPKESSIVDESINETTELKIPGQTKFADYLIEATILDAGYSMLDTRRKRKSRIENQKSKIELVEQFDLDKIKPPLTVRHRRNGDRFVPLGLPEEKKVGKFLTAAKVPEEIRQKTLIVTDSEKILWVWPVRISEQAKITNYTKKILQLHITDTK